MNARQKLFYKQTCDIWRLSAPGSGPVTGTKADAKTYTRIATSVPYRNQSTRYNTIVGPMARADDPNFLTRNDFHFVYGTDVRDGDVIVDTTTTYNSNQSAFRCVGQGELRSSWIANYVEVDTIRFKLSGTNIEATYT